MRTFLVKLLSSWVGGFGFLAVVDFALGSLTYFSLYMFGLQPEPVANNKVTLGLDEFRYVYVGNLAEAMMAIVLLHLFKLYEAYLKPAAWRVGYLLLQVYAGTVVLDHALFASTWEWARVVKDFFYLHPQEIFFQPHIIIATYLLYRFRRAQAGRQAALARQEVEILELKQLKTKAELDALQARINPHFLHNALNSVASLIHQDPDRAEQMVLLLSKFYRYSTGQADNGHLAPLADELELVTTYLKVEKMRFGDRLQYAIEVADEALRQVPVPRFLLQPLAENAIKHGLAKTATPGLIRLRASAENGFLHLEVSDPGPPFPPVPHLGYGLQSIQDRLRLLYGPEARLQWRNEPHKHVIIAIPYQPARLAEPALTHAPAARPHRG
ncbi:MAG: histidine kinase [Bernardetiaceae bacterium]|jgi:sensor histidine kinase YesM|nr:histidine kinase [Bernardetiaceae bacterium]